MKLRIGTIVVLTIMFLLTANALFAIDFSEGKTIQSILTQIRSEQMVSTNDKIVISLISERLLAQLGEALIVSSIPDKTLHNQMHIVMGSTQIDGLRVAHVFLAYSYLKSPTLWEKDYGIAAASGSGWAMHLMTSDESISLRK